MKASFKPKKILWMDLEMTGLKPELSDQDVTSAIERADRSFKDVLKVTDSTSTRIPGNRAKQ